MTQPGTPSGNADSNERPDFLSDGVHLTPERRRQLSSSTPPSLTSSTGPSTLPGPATPDSSGPTTLLQSLQEVGGLAPRKRRRTSSSGSDVATVATSSTGSTMVEDEHRVAGSPFYRIGYNEQTRFRGPHTNDGIREGSLYPTTIHESVSVLGEADYLANTGYPHAAGSPAEESPPPHPTASRFFKAFSAATVVLVAGAGLLATVENKTAPVKVVIVGSTVASAASTLAWTSMEPSWERDRFGAISATLLLGSLVLAVVEK